MASVYVFDKGESQLMVLFCQGESMLQARTRTGKDIPFAPGRQWNNKVKVPPHF